MDSDSEPLRSALEKAANDYINDHFYDGVTTVLSSPAKDGEGLKFIIQIVGNKYNPNNFWYVVYRPCYSLSSIINHTGLVAGDRHTL